MIPNSLVFVDVDTQRDFLEPGGALYMPGSSAIIPNLARLTRFAISRQIPILATACSHHLDDQELRRFPPHCIAGTPGEERIAATARPQSTVVAVSERFTGGIPNHLTLQKCELDLFSRPDADRLIARINEAKPTFVVYGVATEYCVLAVASGLLARECRVALVADAVWAIDPSAEAAILTELAMRGAILTTTDVVCVGSA